MFVDDVSFINHLISWEKLYLRLFKFNPYHGSNVDIDIDHVQDYCLIQGALPGDPKL